MLHKQLKQKLIMKSNIKKSFGMYVLAIAFLLVGCEKDLTIHEHEESKIEKADLKNIPGIFALFNQQSSLMSRNTSMSILDSIIPENVIILEKEDGLKSYTFALSITEPHTKMTNLVIEETDGGYSYFTVTYESEYLETWKEQISNNQQTTVDIQITKNDLNSYASRGGNCTEMTADYICPSGMHNGSEYSQCNYHSSEWSYVIKFKVVPCSEGSGGSGSGGSGSGGSGSGNSGGGSGNGSGNNGGGGGSGSGSSGTTSPNVPSLHSAFIASLSPSQKAWWSKFENIPSKTPMIAFLSKNNYSNESENFVYELIDYLNLNNNSPEAVQEIKNILDILDDGLLGGQPVIVGPDLPITNMAEYLSIFNTSQPATITLYADQPKTGTHYLFNTSDLSARAGHAFISIKQGTKTRTLGFYPQSTAESITPNPFTLDPNDFMSTTGTFGNDQGHSFM